MLPCRWADERAQGAVWKRPVQDSSEELGKPDLDVLLFREPRAYKCSVLDLAVRLLGWFHALYCRSLCLSSYFELTFIDPYHKLFVLFFLSVILVQG